MSVKSVNGFYPMEPYYQEQRPKHISHPNFTNTQINSIAYDLS